MVLGNPRLIRKYLQGNIRYWLYKNIPFLLTPHLREQFSYRLSVYNPECKKEGVCIHCGCKVPNLLFADESCEGKCYPPIFNKEVWDIKKKDYAIRDR